jgi:hypothetical protein
MMIWKTIDFEAILSLDEPLYTQLDQYLYEKEGMLGECIVHSIHIVGETAQLPSKALFRLKLSEALEHVEKRIGHLTLNPKNRPTIKDFRMSLDLINNCLGNYVKTLEGCVMELFEQLDQVGLEKWHKDLPSVFNDLNVMLTHRIEEVSWAIRRLEKLLWQYQKLCTGKRDFGTSLKRWLPGSKLLDRHFLPILKKSRKFLGFRYQKFVDRIANYSRLQEKVQHSFNKFESYRAYNALDSNDRQNFKKVYELLKLWEFNRISAILPKQEIVQALQHVHSEEKTYQLFQEYYHALEQILFHHARLYKLSPQELWKDPVSKTLALDVLSGYRQEIHSLGETILKYRDFLMQTDPNPYMRSRLRLPEWIIGAEPTHCKRLKRLIEQVESLDILFEKLRCATEKGPSGLEETNLSYAAHDVARRLHEASQPLTSRSMMHANVESMTNILADLDELGSFNQNIIDFVGQSLSNILRVDWKYNAAFDIPKFKEVYQIHQGLMDFSKDRQHFNRKNKFKHIIQQIEFWTKKKITQRHLHEIEQDISDIKINLQDFLSFAQRALTKPKGEEQNRDDIRMEITKQLLEYRYQFGLFFYHLGKSEPKERTLRNHFLFVYQYFEAIENILNANYE